MQFQSCSHDKALSILPYLPNAFVFFIKVGHFVILEKGISFLLYAGLIFLQTRGA